MKKINTVRKRRSEQARDGTVNRCNVLKGWKRRVARRRCYCKCGKVLRSERKDYVFQAAVSSLSEWGRRER